MTKYAKGTAGKLIVQDWNIISNYPDRQVLRILTEPQIAALVSLCEFLSWKTRYINFPGQDVIDAFSAETIYNLTTPLDFCELIDPCLAPILDAITALQTQVTNVQTQVTDINSNIGENAASQIPLPEEPDGDAVYAGALALVQAMDRKNRQLYEEAELAAVDNTAEWIGQILDLFPNFSAQGVGAGADMANAYFENQVNTYEADYPDFEVPAACNLKCFIDANDGVLNIDVWGDWLDGIDTLIPDNAPAKVYAKYSPLRQTFLNQIAELINGEQSLKSYFDELWNIYYTGTQTPIPVPPECGCPECGITYIIDIGTEGMDGDVVSAATALLSRLDVSGTAYGRRIQLTFASPVRSIEFGWNTEGALDDMYAKLDDNETVTLEAPAGSMTLEVETPGTVFIVDLGYSGDSDAFDENLARINIIDACE